MIQQTDKVRTNIRGMLLAIVGFLIVAYYGSTALSTRDALWFTQGFTERPIRMIVYHGGQRTELTPDKPAFAELADAVVSSLDKGVDYASGIGFSQGSIDDAYNLYVTLEVFFAQPVLLHATFGTGRPTQMLFPMTGRHSDRSQKIYTSDEFRKSRYKHSHFSHEKYSRDLQGYTCKKVR